MKQPLHYLVTGLIVFFAFSCQTKQSTREFCEESLDFACKQTELLRKESIEVNRIPRTLTATGDMHWAKPGFDWTEGFFPGTCWYLYEYTKANQWKDDAEELQSLYIDHRFLTTNHDLGFVFNCSYGNNFRIDGDKDARDIMIDAGNSLMTRFNPAIGCIQSWNVDSGWQAKRGWQYPVIIDNMMNLELLFELSKITGDDKYKKAAITHANTTMKNHYRPDGSSYHVVDYDSVSGVVRSRQTAQGYAHESAWSRGQAWGLYGYTICYRYTRDKKYLDKAEEIANFIFTDEGMPKDCIPYWDYDAPKIPSEPRDVSAASVIASALIELDGYSTKNYMKEAQFILKNLSSKEYRAELGGNGKFILKHSVGSIPHNAEIDVPLCYADYYYVEALMRLLKTENEKLAAY